MSDLKEFQVWQTPTDAIPLWADGAPGYDASLGQMPPSITPYLVAGKKVRPAVIVCPGGGYTIKAAHEGGPVAEWLNSIGIHAFVLDYRVQPYRHPIPLLDGRRAVQQVRAHASAWCVNPQQVGVLGFSAGGHLASAVGTQFENYVLPDLHPDAVDEFSSRPDSLVLCYPVTSFFDSAETGSMCNLLGASPSDDQRIACSTDRRVSAKTPPTFLWHTADDAVVPVQNALLFANALTAHNVPYELHIFAHGAHGIGLGFDHPHVAPWTDLCARWLKRLYI